MKNIFGNQPVSGENFYGREKFVRLLVGILTSGNSFLLLGLRRIGKSSTITETLRRIKENDKNSNNFENSPPSVWGIFFSSFVFSFMRGR